MNFQKIFQLYTDSMITFFFVSDECCLHWRMIIQQLPLWASISTGMLSPFLFRLSSLTRQCWMNTAYTHNIHRAASQTQTHIKHIYICILYIYNRIQMVLLLKMMICWCWCWWIRIQVDRHAPNLPAKAEIVIVIVLWFDSSTPHACIHNNTYSSCLGVAKIPFQQRQRRWKFEAKAKIFVKVSSKGKLRERV